MLRGLFGVFSTGLDAIASQLKAKGIEAEVAGHLHWSAAIAEIERLAGQTGPLILVGHSQGANNVIDMARSLKSHNIKVDLLVTLAPSLQNPVPTNVTKAINYYQSPGWGEAIVADHGFHGKIINVNLADDPTISHINLDKNAKVQAAIVREIIAIARP
jgi:acetyl esterase/lipase